jgi:hypothetical protein
VTGYGYSERYLSDANVNISGEVAIELGIISEDARRPALLVEIFRGFAKAVQANSGIVFQIMPGTFPSSSVVIHYSLAILSIDVNK